VVWDGGRGRVIVGQRTEQDHCAVVTTTPSEKAAARVVATAVYPMPTFHPTQSSLLTEEGGEGAGVVPNYTTIRKLGPI
jgi:hypothetical protein